MQANQHIAFSIERGLQGGGKGRRAKNAKNPPQTGPAADFAARFCDQILPPDFVAYA
jgi:hypothetical protein